MSASEPAYALVQLPPAYLATVLTLAGIEPPDADWCARGTP